MGQSESKRLKQKDNAEFLQKTMKHLRTQKQKQYGDLYYQQDSEIVNVEKDKEENKIESFKNMVTEFLEKIEQTGKWNMYIGPIHDQLMDNFQYLPYSQNLIWHKLEKQDDSQNKKEYQKSILQNFYSEIQRAKPKKSLIKDLITLFQDKFIDHFTGRMKFKDGLKGLSEKACKQIHKFRQNEVEVQINILVELCTQIFYYAFAQTINESFVHQDYVNLKVHKIITQILFLNKDFSYLVKKIFAYSLKFEQKYAQTYISENHIQDIEFYDVEIPILKNQKDLFQKTINSIINIEKRPDPWQKVEQIAKLKDIINKEIDYYKKKNKKIIQKKKQEINEQSLQLYKKQSQQQEEPSINNLHSNHTNSENSEINTPKTVIISSSKQQQQQQNSNQSSNQSNNLERAFSSDETVDQAFQSSNTDLSRNQINSNNKLQKNLSSILSEEGEENYQQEEIKKQLESEEKNNDKQVFVSVDDYINILTYCIVKTKTSQWIRNWEFIQAFMPQEIYSVLDEMSCKISNFEMAIEIICRKGEEIYQEKQKLRGTLDQNNNNNLDDSESEITFKTPKLINGLSSSNRNGSNEQHDILSCSQLSQWPSHSKVDESMVNLNFIDDLQVMRVKDKQQHSFKLPADCIQEVDREQEKSCIYQSYANEFNNSHFNKSKINQSKVIKDSGVQVFQQEESSVFDAHREEYFNKIRNNQQNKISQKESKVLI